MFPRQRRRVIQFRERRVGQDASNGGVPRGQERAARPVLRLCLRRGWHVPGQDAGRQLRLRRFLRRRHAREQQGGHAGHRRARHRRDGPHDGRGSLPGVHSSGARRRGGPSREPRREGLDRTASSTASTASTSASPTAPSTPFTVGAAHAHVGLVTPGAQSVFQAFDAGAGFDAMSTGEPATAVDGENDGVAVAGDGSARDASSPSGSDDTNDLAVDPATTQAHGGGVHVRALLRPRAPIFQNRRRPRGEEPHSRGGGDVHGVGGAFVRAIPQGLRVRHVQGRAHVVGDVVRGERGEGGGHCIRVLLGCRVRQAGGGVVFGRRRRRDGRGRRRVRGCAVDGGCGRGGAVDGGGGRGGGGWRAWFVPRVRVGRVVCPGAFVLRWAGGRGDSNARRAVAARGAGGVRRIATRTTCSVAFTRT